MSNVLGQKEAVVKAVEGALGSNFKPGETIVKDVISSAELAQVRQTIFDGIKNGTIQYKGESSDDKALSRYVNGMVQNHFRKAKELNGGNQYRPANPGSGRRDEQLSNLKKLLKTYPEGSSDYQKVQDAIATRQAELAEERKANAAAKKQKRILDSIDTSALPSELSEVIENATGN